MYAIFRYLHFLCQRNKPRLESMHARLVVNRVVVVVGGGGGGGVDRELAL